MKVLEKGPGWTIVRKCTGAGNGNGGCLSKLVVEKGDLFSTASHHYDGSSESYVTFECISCGCLNDIPAKDIPDSIKKNLPSRQAWVENKSSS